MNQIVNKSIKLTTTLLILMSCLFSYAQNTQEFKGQILDKNTNKPLALADLTVTKSNISTVSNSEGEFSLKVPENLINNSVVVSYLGYQKLEFKLLDLKTNMTIYLEQVPTVLAEIDLVTPQDAAELVKKTFALKGDNYFNETIFMTGFYRETIKKRNRNASLSEAVVTIKKQSYTTNKSDDITLIKARKNTNYARLDTVALKLQGGPFSSLYTDVIKYPKFIFSNNTMANYDFTFGRTTQIDNKLVYVVNFIQKKTISSPMYYGTLYIDAKTSALTSASYNLNVENREEAGKLFVRKKPLTATVYPTEASYRVNYRTKDGKWYFGYSNIILTFKVNWKNRWFNSKYTLQSEMAITDWEINENAVKTKTQKLRPNSILQNKASGFSDPDFWGAYNIIEPEKSIENAINKISKQLKKE
ncbi:carboxypeptidase-like regulatory domain-containing protein [Olleya sp. HaHaR_3_96]|uniref:carboxypeptidase-like regulatory domain-containing protein n=1 Tax=Olleya sp. HaHaR_3_96 TaxID=2745560 RepID=UPI001C4F0225|nr:carboxypeptidase-like regulatory domain-containing protein [Olleya sp. HaHaR_3_96]QXP61610.1 carboxypeptidase-like regulatory domain-containing protein [Olleya sp. HaHaR_3_96]